ncbi:MAG: PEP-utilizing enzyme [Treponema sp.]|nr:PEP-utilizing enzyme [Treponema sp.]
MQKAEQVKLIVRKYVLNPVFVVLAYTLLLVSLLFYTNPFEKFINPSFLILFPVFLGLRFLDDFSDFYKDKLNGKAVIGRKILFTLSLLSVAVAVLLSVLTFHFLFLAVVLLIVVIYCCKWDFLKPVIVPVTFLIIIFYEFGLHFSNILIISLCLIFSLGLSFMKKKEIYTLEEIGGKTFNLYKLNIKNTPAYYPIKAEYLNPPDKEKLELIVNSFCKNNKLYAVRSSAIDEDSAANSFAGIHDTFLNVKKSEVLEKILAVVESAHSDVAMNYRRENNLSTENIQISVLLQEMVDADFAGVLNTINPVTNNISETVISVTKGLGDKLVDGTVDGTTYYLDGKKIEIKGPDILNKKILKRLLKLADELRAKTNRFQDCEFAVKNGKVYFLQSRAITTYDIDTHNLTLLIDNSNLIESYYGMTSPLTHSFAHEIYSKVYTETGHLTNINEKIIRENKCYLDNMLYSFEGKLYYNLNSWYKVTSVFPSKNSTNYMESMMGVKTGNNSFKRTKLGFFDYIKVGYALLSKFSKIDELSEKFIHNFNEIVNPYYGKNLDHLTKNKLVSLYEEIDSKIIKEFTIPILNDIGVMMNFGRLKEKVKAYPNRDELLAFAVNNNGNVESAQNATEFIKITEYIRANNSILSDFETLTNEELFAKYYETESEFSTILHDYIYRFGPRVINELKLETVTMIENPILIFELLRDSLKNQTKIDIKPSEIEIPASLKRLAGKARHFIQNRERLRLRRTYIFSVIRNIFLSCGKNLEKEGKLDSYRDVFYLTKNEVFYSKENFDYRKTVADRKKQEAIDSKKPYYSRIAFFGDKILPISFINSKGFSGIPSGNGIIKEKVCVMETKDDTFVPGSIIVTKRTDPGWISLFPMASGLIVEHGSMLSHSFVVAREMKLPCIVGVSGITQVLKTGDVVTLDASKGEIKIETEELLQGR